MLLRDPCLKATSTLWLILIQSAALPQKIEVEALFEVATTTHP